jgi:hypothetical protein
MTTELDTAIAEEEARARKLRDELARSEARLKTLIDARRIMRCEADSPGKKRSLPDYIEEILRERGGPMHVDELVSTLRSQDIPVAKGTVTTSISRYVHKGERFRKVAPNKFALAEQQSHE